MMAVWSEVLLSELGEGMRIDAEYYQPKYLELDSRLGKSFELNEILDHLTDGTHITPRYVEAGIPFLSSGNVQPFHVDFDGTKFISPMEHSSLRHCQPQALDLLVSKSGRIGHAAVVPKNIRKGDFNIYEGLALLRIRDYDQFALAAIINSQVVQLQLKRRVKGVAQPHLHLEDIRRIKIPHFPTRLLNRTKDIVLKGISKFSASLDTYSHAEGLLLSELGFGDLDLFPTLFYERDFSKTQEATRLDAEFYQPKYYALIDAIRKTGKGQLLGDIVAHCERGLQPQYADEGDVAVVNTKHMGTLFLSDDFERCSHESWMEQRRAQLKQYDVLFYSTGAYIGRTNCWFGDERAIGSNHVTIIRPNDECNPRLSGPLHELTSRIDAGRPTSPRKRSARSVSQRHTSLYRLSSPDEETRETCTNRAGRQGRSGRISPPAGGSQANGGGGGAGGQGLICPLLQAKSWTPLSQFWTYSFPIFATVSVPPLSFATIL